MRDDDSEEVEERPKFKAKQATFLSCTPGNFDHEEGDPAIIMTLAHTDYIVPVAMTPAETRKVVVALLVSLYTSDDEFAEKVLDQMFPHDADGHYHWPAPE